MSAVLGIDFDNTLVTYDALIHRAALERGLIAADIDAAKRSVRDRIRELPDGEIEWQKLQALVYGPLMPQARLVDGVAEFVTACHRGGLRLFIVSHKTEFAGYDATGTNLRTAALDWMTANRFFDARGLGLCRDDVYFEGTRGAKIDRIRALRCSHFIDDLEEVLCDPSFPPGIEKLLFAPDAAGGVSGDLRVMPSWRAIGEYFFGDRA
jgi:hypothetical protein